MAQVTTHAGEQDERKCLNVTLSLDGHVQYATADLLFDNAKTRRIGWESQYTLGKMLKR